ncbi:MAG: EAL domain-containing protein [Candidatus Eremiobacteraeota bacterium]|nr:EAL domain-containing protein [Candidatus Eremiobacteraeota bacterium]MBC5821525.1 EAL domain-containing protein [Candidatus Eremiobacteraeota bacterium]
MKLRSHSRPLLGLRLGAIACALAVPVVALALGEDAKIDREIMQLRREKVAVHWIALADQLVNDIEMAESGASHHMSATALARIDGRRENLQRFSADIAGAVPSAPGAFAQIDRAWKAEAAAPSGVALAHLATEGGSALDSVSDSSQLSFESHVFIADLGDALDNSYYRVFSPLGAAAETMQAGSLSFGERIQIAGGIALARQFKHELFNDIQPAMDTAPGKTVTLGLRWHAALDSASTLERDLDAAIQKPQGRLAPRVLRGERLRLAARTSEFITTLEADTDSELAQLQGQDRRAKLTILAAALLGIALIVALGTVALRLIGRRDRRELERARQDARALQAELGRQHAERARMLTEAQFDAVFDRSQMGIALLDGEGMVVECNPALRTMLGSASPVLVAPNDPHFEALAAGRSATYQHETALERSDGTPRWSQITISSVDVRSESVAAIAMVQDISERKAIEERLRYAASHDDLTSLLNRTQFLARLSAVLVDHAIASTYSVLFVDLDHFKLVNDTLGHSAGDRAIMITGERLLATTRPDDVLARLHGDEFALLLADTDGAGARAAADRIKEHLLAPIHFGETSFGLTASIGIVTELERYVSAEYVMRDADVAMYHAKSLGRANAVVFDGEMQERVSEQMRILTDLRTALPRNEIYVAYQPIVAVRTSEVLGFEALLRWRSPTLGDVPPSAFIPVAEDSDAIHELGRFALTETCAMVRRLDVAGAPPLRASINLSVAQLVKGDIAAEVRTAVADAGIDAERLTLEITESGLLENKARAHEVLDELHRIGVKLCIDDFGTGYSSLRYLHEFPIDVLKIDRSFVNGADGELANPAIVDMLLSLSRHLDVVAIAEGIETEAQRRALLEAGCEAAQGFLFARPLPEAHFMTWLRAGEELREAAAAVKAS